MSDYQDTLAEVHRGVVVLLGARPSTTAVLDQATSYMAALMSKLDVDLHDATEARAAFAGTYSMFSNLAGLSVPMEVATTCLIELGSYAHRGRF